jgi:hypothetical protein
MSISNQLNEEIKRERERLVNPPKEDDKPTGLGCSRFVVQCEHGAANVLESAKKILMTIDGYYDTTWPTLEEWRDILPKEFVDRCKPEMTMEERLERIAYMKTLSDEEEREFDEKEAWTLSGWLYWLELENRTWFWWDARIFDKPINDTHFLIAITILDWPFPWGALKWLFKACGAIAVIPEEDILKK